MLFVEILEFLLTTILFILFIFSLYYNLFRYGYVTNTKIKFIIVVDSNSISLRENEVRTVSKNKKF